MYFLVLKIFGTRYWPALVGASLIYSYNWVTFAWIGNLTVTYEYSVAPMVVWLISAIAIDKRSNYTFEFLLAICLFFGTLFYSVVGLSILAPAILVGLFAGLFSIRGNIIGNLGRYVSRLVISFLMFIVVSLPFSFPQVVGILTKGGIGYYTSVGFGIASSYLAQIGPQNFVNVFAFPVSTFSLLTSPTGTGLLMVIGCVIFCVTLFSLFDSQTKKFAISLGIVMAMISLLIQLIIAQNPLINSLYSKIPFLVPLDGVVPYSIVLGYIEAILLGIGSCWLISTIQLKLWRNGRSFPKLAISLILVALLVAPFLFSYNYEILSFGTLSQRTYTSGAESYPGTIPNYLMNLTNFLNHQREDAPTPYRILWLPQENYLSGMITTLSIADLFTSGGLVANPPLYSDFKNAISELIKGNQNFSDAMALLGFRYIVILKAISQVQPIGMTTGPDSYIVGNPTAFNNALSNQTNVTMLENNENYTLYEVHEGNNVFPSLFWVSDNQSTMPVVRSNVRILKMSPSSAPSSYQIEVDSSGPVYLTFAENYNSNWKASLSVDGKSVSSQDILSMGWANGFLIPGSGIRVVTLSYSGQVSYNELLFAWIVLFPLLTIFVILRSPVRLQIKKILAKNTK